MKKLIILTLLAVAFITLSFRMIGNRKGNAPKEVSTEASQSGGFTSSDPIN